MYKIIHDRKTNILNIESISNGLHALIHLDDGASLQELSLDGFTLIDNLAPLNYSDTYASSLLFPFANRIKDGKYTFNGKPYQFEINEPDNNNALHGLIFNKPFKIVGETITNTFAAIKLAYNETTKVNGFPYTYNFEITYTFKKDNVSLDVSVTNTDTNAFPFTLGWHPYFLSDNLQESSVNFSSNKKIVIGERCIGSGVEDITSENIFNIENKTLDDCWVLNTNQVQFNTPEYNLLLSTTAQKNFLQLYTPSIKNIIAIEPTTGVSDSFNNAIGLQTLNPNDTYQINWTIKLI